MGFERLLGERIVALAILHDRQSITFNTADGQRCWYVAECSDPGVPQISLENQATMLGKVLGVVEEQPIFTFADRLGLASTPVAPKDQFIAPDTPVLRCAWKFNTEAGESYLYVDWVRAGLRTVGSVFLLSQWNLRRPWPEVGGA